MNGVSPTSESVSASAGRWRRLVAALCWLAANLVLSYCAMFPLLFIAAMSTGAIDSGEVAPTVVVTAAGTVVVLGAFVGANLALRSRLRSWRWYTFWFPAIVMQFVPFALFRLFDTPGLISTVLGNGLFR